MNQDRSVAALRWLARRGRLLLALPLLHATPSLAQQPPLLLAPDHWAVAALDRLSALGLITEVTGSGSSVVRPSALVRFREAADSAAARGDSRAARLARSYVARLEAEFARADAAPLWLASAAAGGRFHRGNVLAGYERDERRVAPSPLAARAIVVGESSAALRLGSFAAAEFTAAWSEASVELGTGSLGVAAGPLALWAGRREVGFGGEGGRSLVLQGGTPFDGVGLLLLPRPSLPGMLRHLGRVRAETFFARLHVSGGIAHPWFWAARIEAQPHPRLRIAVSRAAAFGGAGNSALRLGEVPILLLGLAGGRHGETENQVASLALRWRPPAGQVPLQLYGEWAFDDMGLSYFHVPGLLLGGELPITPLAPGLATGMEWTWFAGHCCGNPPWYRHSALPWMDRRRPLAHPLGGNGSELRVYGRADALAGTAECRSRVVPPPPGAREPVRAAARGSQCGRQAVCRSAAGRPGGAPPGFRAGGGKGLA